MDTKKNALLSKIEKKMKEEELDYNFINELLRTLQNSAENQEEFQTRMYNLHYRLPEEFQEQETCIKIYQVSEQWIEKEVTKLENETKLSWKEQTEDIHKLDESVRKTQLVIRHRFSEILYDLNN